MEREYLYKSRYCNYILLIVCIFLNSSKESSRLGQKWKKGIPIEVIPMSRKPIQNKIEAKYGGEAILRMSADKAVSQRLDGRCVLIQSTWKVMVFLLGTFGNRQRKLLIRLGVS